MEPLNLTEARELAGFYVKLGCRPVWTCAPHQLPGGPTLGDHIIVGESNVVACYNSVIGARTNKYGDFLDVCAGLTDRVPYARLRTDQGRQARIRFDTAGLPEPLRRSRSWSQIINQAQDIPEQFPRHRHLGHLERDVAPVTATFAPIFTSFSRSVVNDQ